MNDKSITHDLTYRYTDKSFSVVKQTADLSVGFKVFKKLEYGISFGNKLIRRGWVIGVVLAAKFDGVVKIFVVYFDKTVIGVKLFELVDVVSLTREGSSDKRYHILGVIYIVYPVTLKFSVRGMRVSCLKLTAFVGSQQTKAYRAKLTKHKSRKSVGVFADRIGVAELTVLSEKLKGKSVVKNTKTGLVYRAPHKGAAHREIAGTTRKSVKKRTNDRYI